MFTCINFKRFGLEEYLMINGYGKRTGMFGPFKKLNDVVYFDPKQNKFINAKEMKIL